MEFTHTHTHPKNPLPGHIIHSPSEPKYIYNLQNIVWKITLETYNSDQIEFDKSLAARSKQFAWNKIVF